MQLAGGNRKESFQEKDVFCFAGNPTFIPVNEVAMELKEILTARYRLSGETAALLFERMEPVSFEKKATVQPEGTTDRYVYFVESGLVRSFIRRDGKDITLYIAAEGDIPLASAGLTRPVLAGIAIGALTRCVLWRLPRTELGQLCAGSLAFANLAREWAEHLLARSEVFFTDYYPLDKKQQYELLLRQQPELFRRIPLNEIAAYLDVTPQSLSRIRGRPD